MSYNKISIYDAVREIDAGRMYLPALQRRFVWGKEQIELLFDSIIRGYPFGTFLFWKLAKENANSYVFYEFKKTYDERNPFNERKIGAFTPDHITGVLDGQQRLSSIYVGLQGTHTERGYRKRVASPDAYQKTRLYLNLLSLPYHQSESGGLEQDEQRNFEFRFLTDSAVNGHAMRQSQAEPERKEFVYWFRIGEIMYWPTDPDLDHYIDLMADSCKELSQAGAIRDARRVIRSGLNMLYRQIHENGLINFFEISKDDLEDILKIFVRVNSGGTVLSKTDLLFSTIVATWDEGREEIEGLQKRINAMGQGFGFGTEYLMRCCLVLSDGPVVYKVNSFKAENVQDIRTQWYGIAKAIVKTVELLVEFGYSSETLTSHNATIPVAYYVYKGGLLDSNAKSGIQLYLIHSLLKLLFGSSQDQLLSRLRGVLRSENRQPDGKFVLREDYRSFDFSRLAEVSLPSGKSLKVTNEDIDRFLELRKGPASFSVLQLLYPHLRYREISFHQDHMHPSSGFSKERLEQIGLDREMQALWLEWRDQIPNLQLMEGAQNLSKQATPLKDWLAKMSEQERQNFHVQNRIPADANLEFSSFPDFFSARRELLRNILSELLSLAENTVTQERENLEIERVSDEDMEHAVFHDKTVEAANA